MTPDEIAPSSVPGSPMPAIDKALRALLELAEAGNHGLSLADLADRLGLNRSSLHLTLRALRHRQFADQDPVTGRYVVGANMLAAAFLYQQNFDLRGTLRPTLVRMADQLNEVVHLSVLDGTDLLYIEKVESRRPIQPATSIGLRLPAVTTAMGRAIIGAQFHDFDAFERRFDGTLHPRTAKAPRTLAEEWRLIEEAQRRGYASDVENSVEGLCAVAVAIRMNEAVVGAISIVTLADDFRRAGEEHYATTLRQFLESDLRPPLSIADLS
jgi:IclR family acetate operon transcriptional repressor